MFWSVINQANAGQHILTFWCRQNWIKWEKQEVPSAQVDISCSGDFVFFDPRCNWLKFSTLLLPLGKEQWIIFCHFPFVCKSVLQKNKLATPKLSVCRGREREREIWESWGRGREGDRSRALVETSFWGGVGRKNSCLKNATPPGQCGCIKFRRKMGALKLNSALGLYFFAVWVASNQDLSSWERAYSVSGFVYASYECLSSICFHTTNRAPSWKCLKLSDGTIFSRCPIQRILFIFSYAISLMAYVFLLFEAKF